MGFVKSTGKCNLTTSRPSWVISTLVYVCVCVCVFTDNSIIMSTMYECLHAGQSVLRLKLKRGKKTSLDVTLSLAGPRASVVADGCAWNATRTSHVATYCWRMCMVCELCLLWSASATSCLNAPDAHLGTDTHCKVGTERQHISLGNSFVVLNGRCSEERTDRECEWVWTCQIKSSQVKSTGTEASKCVVNLNLRSEVSISILCTQDSAINLDLFSMHNRFFFLYRYVCCSFAKWSLWEALSPPVLLSV